MISSRENIKIALSLLIWLGLFTFVSDLVSYLAIFPEYKPQLIVFYSLGTLIFGALLAYLRYFSPRTVAYFGAVFVIWLPLHMFIASSGINELNAKNKALLNAFEILEGKIRVKKVEQACFLDTEGVGIGDKKALSDPYSGNPLNSKFYEGKCYLASVGPDLKENPEVILPNEENMVIYFKGSQWNYLILDDIAYMLSGYSNISPVDIGVLFDSD